MPPPTSETDALDDPEPSVQLPRPPDGLSPDERRAWRQGCVAMARVVGGFAMTMAKAGAREADDEDDADDDRCPECGGEVLDALGGPVCVDCGHEPAADPTPDQEADP